MSPIRVSEDLIDRRESSLEVADPTARRRQEPDYQPFAVRSLPSGGQRLRHGAVHRQPIKNLPGRCSRHSVCPTYSRNRAPTIHCPSKSRVVRRSGSRRCSVALARTWRRASLRKLRSCIQCRGVRQSLLGKTAITNDSTDHRKCQAKRRVHNLLKAEDRDTNAIRVDHDPVVAFGDVFFQHRVQLFREKLMFGDAKTIDVCDRPRRPPKESKPDPEFASTPCTVDCGQDCCQIQGQSYRK